MSAPIRSPEMKVMDAVKFQFPENVSMEPGRKVVSTIDEVVDSLTLEGLRILYERNI